MLRTVLYGTAIAAALALFPSNLVSLPIAPPAEAKASAHDAFELFDGRPLVAAEPSMAEEYLLLDTARLFGMPARNPGVITFSAPSEKAPPASAIDECPKDDRRCHALVEGDGPRKGTFQLALPDGSRKTISRFEAWREMRCLAFTAWAEARSEGVRGMLAVMQVIVNRMITKGHPESICAIVSEPGQFDALEAKDSQPWLSTAKAKERMVPSFSPKLEGPDAAAAKSALAMAWRLMAGQVRNDQTKGATFFATADLIEKHGSGVIAPNLETTAVIGDHVFLRPMELPIPAVKPRNPKPWSPAFASRR